MMNFSSETSQPLAAFSGVAPMFPLPNAVLFPHLALPLHIFEERYRRMASDYLSATTERKRDGTKKTALVIAPTHAEGDRITDHIRDVARFVPMDRLLIETDSPYLAPVPHRGKTNNPSYVPWVAQQLAAIKDCSVEDVAITTSGNFSKLFSGVNLERLL